MVPPQISPPDALSGIAHEAGDARDVCATEFAQLVDRYTPSGWMTPSIWLWQLPNEAFRYYRGGIQTFGSQATTTLERRGPVYLVQSTLLFMWMSWGEETAQERFRSDLDKGVRRTASLVMLESYRRGGALDHCRGPQLVLRASRAMDDDPVEHEGAVREGLGHESQRSAGQLRHGGL